MLISLEALLRNVKEKLKVAGRVVAIVKLWVVVGYF
jgi:DNA-binding CsgD family transcriptional regulator